MRPRANSEGGAKMQPSWRPRSQRDRTRGAERQSDGDTKPLDVMTRLMLRCCDVLDEEDKKGDAADRRRIDRALKTAAALARSAAPYYHRRIKPADHAPGEKPLKQEIVVSWTPPPKYNPDTWARESPGGTQAAE
jgi:hypothetical protein